MGKRRFCMMKGSLLGLIIMAMLVAGCASDSESSPSQLPYPSDTPTTKPGPTVKPSPTPAQAEVVIEGISPNPAYVNDVVTFKGSVSQPDRVKTYRWRIEGRGPIAYKDAFVSAVATEEPGTYTMVFEAQYEDDSWSSPASRDLQVIPRPPAAGFQAQPTSGAIPLKVEFTDTTDKAVTSWMWDFGDGFTSKIENPSHTYVAPGRYTVSLTVEGPDGSDTEIRQDLIEAIQIEYSGSPTTGYSPLEVQFADSSRKNITGWAWYFGDGDISNEPNPTHTYTEAGVYSVSLTVVGKSNATVSKTKTDYIHVLEPPPVAGFFCHESTYVNVEEPFRDLSEGTLTSWQWDFGDGTLSHAPNPTHAYTASGTYTVRLTVEGPGGSDFTEKSITVKSWE